MADDGDWGRPNVSAAALGDTKERRPTAMPVVASRTGMDCAMVEMLKDCDILVK